MNDPIKSIVVVTTHRINLKPTEPATRLVDEKTGEVVPLGSTVTDFRGDTAIVTGWRPGSHPGSTGRIYVKVGTSDREYFPSVFGCKVVPAR